MSPKTDGGPGMEDGERLGRMESTLSHMGDSIKIIATDVKEERKSTGQFQIEAVKSLERLNTKLEAHEGETDRRLGVVDDRFDGVSEKLGKLMSSRAALGAGAGTGAVGVLALLDKIFGILPG